MLEFAFNVKLNYVFLVVMKPLLLGIAALLVSLPSHSQTVPVESEAISAQSGTVYLVLNTIFASGLNVGSLTVHSLPMQSIQQCEESGIKLLASKRYKINKYLGKLIFVGFECIEGK